MILTNIAIYQLAMLLARCLMLLLRLFTDELTVPYTHTCVRACLPCTRTFDLDRVIHAYVVLDSAVCSIHDLQVIAFGCTTLDSSIFSFPRIWFLGKWIQQKNYIPTCLRCEWRTSSLLPSMSYCISWKTSGPNMLSPIRKTTDNQLLWALACYVMPRPMTS